jgi:hypothetical protein
MKKDLKSKTVFDSNCDLHQICRDQSPMDKNHSEPIKAKEMNSKK